MEDRLLREDDPRIRAINVETDQRLCNLANDTEGNFKLEDEYGIIMDSEIAKREEQDKHTASILKKQVMGVLDEAEKQYEHDTSQEGASYDTDYKVITKCKPYCPKCAIQTIRDRLKEVLGE